MQQRLAMVALAMAATIWGGMYVVSRLVLAVIPAIPLVELRLVIALIVLLPWAIAGRVWRISLRQASAIAGIGIIGYTCSLALQFIGTALTSASLGALVTSSAPAAIVLFAALSGEKPTVRGILALGLATLGVAGTAGVDLGSRNGGLGVLALSGAAITWALYTVLGRRLTATVPVFTTLYLGLLAGAIALLPFALPTWPNWSTFAHLSFGLWLGILFLGIVAVAVAFFCWNYGFAHLPSEIGAVFYLLQPVVGTVLGVTLLREPWTITLLAGGVLILCGTLLASLRPARVVTPTATT